MSFGDLGGADSSWGTLGGGRRPARYPALPPEEATTALQGLKNAGLSSLAYVGSVLDKFGGRAVRGSLDALMGQGGSRELLSLIPFSDTLGITNPEDVATHRGSQLLKHAFNYDPEKAQGHWGAWAERNILGPAVELGLDPSTYVGGISALTKGGQAAAKLGKVPRIFQEGYLGALGRGERTLVHGLTGRPGVAVAEAGMRGAEVANDLLRRIPGVAGAQDVAGKWAQDVAVPHWKAWTDPLSKWIPNKEIQRSARAIKSPEMEIAERGLMEEQGRMNLARNQLIAAGHDPEKLTTFLEQAREGVTDPRYVDQAFAATLPPEAHALAARTREIGQRLPRVQEAAVGLEGHTLQDLMQYGMRTRNPIYDLGASPAERAAATQAKLLPTTHAAQKQRLLGARGYAGGTEELNALIAQHAGQPVADIVPQLKEAVAGRMGLPVGTQFSVLPGSEQAQWAREAAGFLSSIDPKRLVNKVTGKVEPYYVRNPIEMSLRRGWLGAEATTSARTIADVLARTAKPVAHFGPEEAKIGVADVLKSAKMETPQALRSMAAALGHTPEDILTHAQQIGGPAAAQRALRVGAQGQVPDLVAQLGGIPAEVGQQLGLAQRAMRAGAAGNVPREVGEDLATAALQARRGVDLGAFPTRAFRSAVRRPGVRQGMFPGAVESALGEDLGTAARQGMFPGEAAVEGVAGKAAQDFGPATAALRAERGVKLGAPAGAADEMRALRSLLNQHAVDAKTGKELTQLLSRGGPAPYELTGLERIGQKILRPTKNALYTMWMSSHVRNDMMGKLAALTEAGVTPWSKGYKVGRTILRDPATVINPGIKGVKDSQQLLTEAFADRIIDAHAGELAAKLPEELQVQRFAKDPFAPRPTLGKAFTEFKDRIKTGPWVSPIGEKGAGVQLGHAVNTIVENELRLGQYIDMRRRGFARDVARERVFKTHFDYERGQGPMERRVLNAALVFPTFSRFNIPKQLGLAATHPARISGPLRFAGGGMGDEENYIPRYLQGGLNFPIPMPGLPAGTKGYLTNLGTPMEEAFGHLKIGSSPASTLIKTGQGLMGMVRPDVKAALEVLSNTQFHTGRKLSELDAGALAKLAPYIGEEGVTLLYQAIQASPLSRLGSTAQMLTDPRKFTPSGTTMNLARLLTGIKYSDVDVEKQKANDERALLEEQLGRSRNIRLGSYPFVPKSKQEFLTEREQQLMQLWATSEKNARVRRAQTQNAQFGNP